MVWEDGGGDPGLLPDALSMGVNRHFAAHDEATKAGATHRRYACPEYESGLLAATPDVVSKQQGPHETYRRRAVGQGLVVIAAQRELFSPQFFNCRTHLEMALITHEISRQLCR